MSSASGPSPQRAAARRAWESMRALVLDRYDRRKEACAALGLGFVRIKALREACQATPTMRELASRLGIDPPYATLIVDDLEQRRLVERRTHPSDGRAKVVHATAAGRRAWQRAARILGEPPAELLALPGAELAELDRLLAKLLIARAEPSQPAARAGAPSAVKQGRTLV